MGKNRTAFYVHLFAKLIPKQIDGDLSVNVSEGPLVKVILPFNDRCDPALLGDTLHRETRAECAARRARDTDAQRPFDRPPAPKGED